MLTQLISNNLRPNPHLGLTEELPIIRPIGINGLFNSNDSGFGHIRQNSILNSIEFNAEIFNNLKKISFFELLEQTPTIKQLFSTDYKDLVQDLINAQNHKLNLREEISGTFENVIHNLDPNNKDLKLAQFNDFAVNNTIAEKSNVNLNDPLNNSRGIESFVHNPDYNHLLHQEGSRNPNMQSRQPKSDFQPKKHQQSETRPQPYDEKKESKKNTNLGQSLMQAAAKALNSLSLKLNEFAK